ncbi:uncharacterized protein LOC130947895 [Arachis stenosperma]|uniref:uncharacterized protein LOC130947895 n=1 Tax=Arachis stenosperma TaxID=217475 RepID=UPI0025AC655F|nr:uncharacterized protein LOC130947895 [Arachis stenosperma]
MADVTNTTRDTVIAAASVIFSAESRPQPPSLPKKRWGSCWSSYWCFGSHKTSKRIGHAVNVPEPVASSGQAAPTAPNSSTAVVMPFAVPPSSPASVFQSNPSSAIQSPAGPLSLSSLSANAFSSGGPASIFTIGPYAYETQLVSPPVFSNFTTEPSTASFTPPPESVHQTTPSSPEVPFAQLVASSLDLAHKNSGRNHKFALFNYDYHSYQQYPGSPGGQLISPGSVISTSGSSTPFPDRHPILEFHKEESSKFLSSEHFTGRKWSSRLGSGSLTPDGAGQSSRLCSGSATPDVAGHGSRLGSGSLTPNVTGHGSRLDSQLGSGCLTPDRTGSNSRLSSGSLTPVQLASQQISEASSLANSGNGCQTNPAIVDHRVSFEFTGEDVARCLANKAGSLLRNTSQSSQGIVGEHPLDKERMQIDSNTCALCSGKPSDDQTVNAPGEGEERRCEKHNSSNSSKEFNFDSRKGVTDVVASGSDWWTNKKVAGKEGRSSNSWAFFPMLQPENN